ncbi:2-oxo acid dehydrogenase subunit E2 [Gammaproteobacteria bacterium]|nr:2-oxo acid dehydrogenase subunit E2 [Gammaproteobacteria bacterium]
MNTLNVNSEISSNNELEKSDNKKRIFASPLAKRLANDLDVNLNVVRGTGPHGRIVKSDIENTIIGETAEGSNNLSRDSSEISSTLPAKLPVHGSYSEIPNSSMRKIIADRLTASSRDIPAYSVTVDCIIDHLLEMRADLNARSPRDDKEYKISVNDFVIRAIALSMRKVPDVNSSWTEPTILRYDNIDISVAVATPDGLITPIIRHADQKGLAQISIEMKELAVRARANKLLPEEFQGGGFTISNLGMHGVKEFTSIINAPQSCILSVGVGEKRPAVIDGGLGIATAMSCTLTSDHRTVDGALAAKFLQVFKAMIEDPLTMLL